MPEPGSGDTEFRQLAEAYSWCADCGRFVGRACCWGGGPTCLRCAQSRAASGDAESAFAALAAGRAAVRQMAGTVATFPAVEEAVAGTDGAGLDAALAAWEASWLAAGALRSRIDGSRAAARSWLRAIPPAEADRAAELEQELGQVTASLEARWQAVIDILTDAGTRLANRLGQDRPTDTSPEPTRPGGAPVPVAVPVAVPARGKVAFRVAAGIREPVRETTRAMPRAPATATATARRPSAPPPAPPIASPVLPPDASRTAQPMAPSHGGTLRPPVPRPAARPQPVDAPVRTVPDPRLDALPAPAAARGRSRQRSLAIAALVTLAAVVLTGALLAATIGPLARQLERGAGGAADVPAAGDASDASTAATRTASPTESPIGTGIQPPTLLTVDLHPVGPLDPGELPITRVIGAPEVVPFPSPFDRSVRLAGVTSGFCVEASSPSGGSPASMAFDLHLAEAADGWLAVSLPARADGPPMGLRLDLAMLGELDRERWYRLTVTADGPAGRFALTPAGESGELNIDPTIPTSAHEACVQAMLQASEASLVIDNLLVDG